MTINFQIGFDPVTTDILKSIATGLTFNQSQLGRIIDQLRTIQSNEVNIMADLAGLEAEVKKNTDVQDSAIVLLKNLHDLLVAAGTDPVKLQAITDTLATKREALAAAIVANTPVAPLP